METIGDLIDSFQLYAVCTDCERMERVRVQAIIDRYGADLTIDSVRRRLRCSSCAQRTGDIRIVYVGEESKLSGFHYRGNGPAPRLQVVASGTTPQPVSSSMDSSLSPKPSTPT